MTKEGCKKGIYEQYIKQPPRKWTWAAKRRFYFELKKTHPELFEFETPDEWQSFKGFIFDFRNKEH